MEWSDEHDLVMMKEMVSREIFSFKKGSPNRGKTWESIQEFLNQIENPKFQIKDKRGVRDRWNILQGKFKKRMREEEAATGIECEEMSEKDTIIEQLTERERSFQAKEKSTVKEKEAAESVRKKAMERMKDSKKKVSQNSGLEPGLAAGGKKITKECDRARTVLEGKGEERTDSVARRDGIEEKGERGEGKTTTRSP